MRAKTDRRRRAGEVLFDYKHRWVRAALKVKIIEYVRTCHLEEKTQTGQVQCSGPHAISLPIHSSSVLSNLGLTRNLHSGELRKGDEIRTGLKTETKMKIKHKKKEREREGKGATRTIQEAIIWYLTSE
jgi:hypothetical protein